MSHPYTESHLVEQPAIALFDALGWNTVSPMEEPFGPSGTLGRETRGEVVLATRLRPALTMRHSGLLLEATTFVAPKKCCFRVSSPVKSIWRHAEP
jgi:type I restriction enzyme, R subunit